jgi:hypothetical protein
MVTPAAFIEHARAGSVLRPHDGADRPVGDTTMTNNWRLAFTTRGLWPAVATLGLTAALLAVPGRAALAQSAEGRGIVGTWFVQVTLRNCQTAAPLGPPFNSLVTFHADGTIVEAAGSTSFAPGQRSPAHGTWTRQGPRTYRQRMAALLLFDTPAGYPVPPGGFQAGGQTVDHTVTLVDDNRLTSTGTNTFYTTSLVPYRSGCSTAEAVRFP